VACPRCGYNLRGMRGGVCAECGAAVDFGVFRRLGPRRATYRWGQAGAFLAGMAGMAGLVRTELLVHRRAGAVEIALVVGMSAAGCLIAAAWRVGGGRVARWPGHVQGRVASAIWAWLALTLIVGMGVGAM